MNVEHFGAFNQLKTKTLAVFDAGHFLIILVSGSAKETRCVCPRAQRPLKSKFPISPTCSSAATFYGSFLAHFPSSHIEIHFLFALCCASPCSDWDDEVAWVAVLSSAPVCSAGNSHGSSPPPPAAGSLTPIRWCPVSDLIKLLYVIQLHNVWLASLWRTCPPLHLCTPAARSALVSTPRNLPNF